MTSASRLYEQALVCPPSDSYPRAISTHPKGNQINLTLARKQHETYTKALKSHGIALDVLKPLNSLPDSVFVQDPALVGKNSVLIGRSRELSRQPEAEIMAKHFLDRGKIVVRLDPKAMLEGGDILVCGETVFVGITGRSNAEGFQGVQKCFPATDVRPVKFSAEFFHLLSTCSYVADNQILMCESYVNPSVFEGFECLPVLPEDGVAVNVLPLGEGRVLMPIGYPRVSKLLRDHGYQPVEIDNSEFVKGDGRITCMSLPFYKNLE